MLTNPTVPALQDMGFEQFRSNQWRAFQAEAVEFAVRSDKKFVILQAPTGAGKSPIALSIARLLLQRPGVRRRLDKKGNRSLQPQASILTATKQLQAQYTADFADAAKEVKGRANFPCLLDNVTAAEGLCTLADVSEVGCQPQCPYFVHNKWPAEASPIVIHSYAYFLNAANYAGSFTEQELLVLDEGHLLDDMLMSFLSVSARLSTCTAFQVSLPAPGKTWGWTQWQSWANAYRGDLEDQLEGLAGQIETDLVVRRRYKAGVALARTMQFLQEAREKWVCVPSTDGFDFMPVWVGQYADQFLYHHGRKVLIMSATILNPDTFCKVVGIDPAQVDFMDMPSTFPVGSRPIYYYPVMDLKGGQHDLGYYKPLADEVYSRIQDHKGEKGLLHCVAYAVAQALIRLAPADLKRRLLTHVTADRLQVYEQFRRRIDDPVLLSPSMKEGVSLEDDQCRFIGVCKVPFPYLGSPQIKARMDSAGGQAWYAWKTMCDLIQMTGRGMRNELDSCAVYIWDGNFKRLFGQTKKWVPKHWRADLVDVKGEL